MENDKLIFVEQLKHPNKGFPKGASHPLVGVEGATPHRRRSQAAKYPLPLKTEKELRNATEFRGEADTTASPCCNYTETIPSKRA
ncbi:MAG: hypothetical protein IJ035_02380, partial [Oscillospiraceae bacterium]|nr:hypothetical protein [Oscillospiraceae bacterium]